MQYVYNEPAEYSFVDRDGHDGKAFATNSSHSEHLIIECNGALKVSLTQAKAEFNYYVVDGQGYFVINGEKFAVNNGDLIVLPPGTKYTYGGKLKMLLINTPKWSPDQEISEKITTH